MTGFDVGLLASVALIAWLSGRVLAQHATATLDRRLGGLRG